MERHVRKSEKIVGGGKKRRVWGGLNVLGGQREGGRERLRLGRVVRQRGRVRVVRERRAGEQGRREGGREGRGRSERMEKCGDIAAERMV